MDGRPTRVLLAEDNPTDALLVREALLQSDPAGFELAHVERLHDAIGRLAAGSFDVLLLDLGLPDSHGLDSVSKIRSRSKEIPIVILTGLADEALALRALSDGVEDYLVKGEATGPVLARVIRYAMGRHAAEQALRESEKRFRATFDNAAVGIAHLSPDGRHLRVNQKLCAILGYSEAELRGRTFQELTHPDELAGETDRLRQVLSGALDTYAVESRCLSNDQGPIWINRTMSLVRGPGGAPEYLIAVTEDISERRRVQADRDQLLAREQAARADAEAASRAKDQFLGVVSHELRTPLTPVMLLTSALQTNGSLPAEVLQDLETIHSHVKLEVRLIDDLLDLTRGRAGKLQLRREPFDAHDLIREAVAVHDAESHAKGIAVELKLRASNPTIYADPGRVRQVLWNLLANAVKFTPDRGRIVVETANDPVAGRLRIAVRDNGIGIEADVMPRLFRAFEQAEQALTRRFGGLGLGLTICKTIVDLHHGAIAVHSEGKGRGTTFTVELPLASPEATESSIQHELSAPARRTMRVLLVEDNPETLRVLSRLLQSRGFTVHTESTVGAALQVAEAEPFDVLLCDIGLPDGTGWELMHRLRKKRPIPAIAVSGFTSDDDRRASADAGFLCHLGKPVSVEQVEEAIQLYISSSSGGGSPPA